MLPQVVEQQYGFIFAQDIVMIMPRQDFKLAMLIFSQKNPARPEMLHAGFDEDLLEGIERTEFVIDRLRQSTAGAATGRAGLQSFPEILMMQMASTLVMHGLPDRVGQLVYALQQFFDAEAVPLRIVFECRI